MSRNLHTHLFLLIIQALASPNVTHGTPVVVTFTPTSSPVTGATRLTVSGHGFIKSGILRSKCHFRITNSARFSPVTVVFNSTFLVCWTPDVPFLDASTASFRTVTFRVSAGAKFSNPNDFVFFNFERITINAIRPAEGSVAREGVVTISGYGFYGGSEMVCLVDGVSVSSAVYINSTILRCRLPPVHASIRVTIKVSLNGGDASGIIPANDSSSVYTFYHDAPRLISVAFSRSLTEILLEFNTEVEIGVEDETNSGRDPDCKTILDDESYVWIGGANALCYWATQQQRRVVVALPSTARVMIGSTLSLRGGNVRVRWQLFSRLARGNETVTLLFDVGQLVGIIEGPAMIPACGNATITGRNSHAVGYVTLNYTWWVSRVDINDVLDLSVYDVDTLLLPASWFAWNVTYVIHLVVSSRLGFVSETTNYTLTRATTSLPIIKVLGPLTKTVLCADDLLLESVVSLPSCSRHTSIRRYQWTITLNDRLIPLDSIISNTPVLSVPHGTLACNHLYHAWLSVYSSDSSQRDYDVTNSSSILIQTVRKQLDARILGGTAWSISQLQEFRLDGSLSLDPNNNHDDDALYVWNCVVYNTTLPCANTSSGYELVFPDDSVAFDEPVNLHPQQSYEVTLNYSKMGRFSVTHAVITITDEPEEVPIVGIIPPTNIQSINPSEQVTIQAFVDSHFDTMVVWSSRSDLPGYGHLNLSDPSLISTPNQYQLVSNFSTILTTNGDLRKYLLVTSDDDGDDLRSVFLTIRPHALRAGIPYQFQVTATNQFGSNFAQVSIKTAPVPSSCRVSVEPSVGQAFDTFTIQVVRCVVEENRYPLLYRYGVKRGDDDEIEWLGGVTYRSSLSTLLPVGNRDKGSELLIVVHVEDNQQVYQTFSSVVVVEESNSTSLTSIEAQIGDEAVTDWRLALRHLHAVLLTINDDPTQFTTKEVALLKLSTVTLLDGLSGSSIPRQKDELMQLLLILLKVTERDGLHGASDATIKTVIRLVESAVSDVVRYDTMNRFNAGFSAHEGAQVLDIYSNLLPRKREDIVRNQVTDSLERVVNELGFGMCKWQTYGSVKESAAFDLGALETSVSTPLGVHHIGCSRETTSNCNINPYTNSMVDYGSLLSHKYLTWSCHGNETCNGVCTVSAHFTANLFQSHSVYNPVHKSDTISLSLLDPKLGSDLEIEDLREPIVLTLKLTVPSERNGSIQCVYWDKEVDRTSTHGCITRLDVADTEVLPIGSSVYCECDHLSTFFVIEQCAPGFYGIQCEHTCPQGLWGIDCANTCDCNSRGTCHHVDGQCDCRSGWIGEQCEIICVDGMWGKDCSTICDCQNNAACDAETGTCSCSAGWVGANCNTSCDAGYYGKDCAQLCRCQNNANCSAVTGECMCSAGYRGDNCSEKCSDGTYGHMCQKCLCDSSGTSKCHHITGECTCHEKWNGTYCENEIPEPLPAPSAGFPVWTIGVVLCVVLLVVGVILLYFYYRKRKRGKMVVSPVDEVDGEDEEDEVVITKARSMEFILRTKPDTRDRIEWEVAKVKETRKKKRKASDTNINDDNNGEPTVEILPKKIRLKPDATLADLREALMDENWFEEGAVVKFLLRGDQRLFYSRDQEPVVILAQVFVENEGFRTIHVLESKEVKKRKKSRAVSGQQRDGSLRRKALRNASVSSQVTGSQASMSISYTSYSMDGSYTESFTDSDEGESGSETEHTEESAFEDDSVSDSNPSPSQSLSGLQSDQVSEEKIDIVEAQPSTNKQHTSAVQSDSKTFEESTVVTFDGSTDDVEAVKVNNEETAEPSTPPIDPDSQSEQCDNKDLVANLPTETQTPKVENESRD